MRTEFDLREAVRDLDEGAPDTAAILRRVRRRVARRRAGLATATAMAVVALAAVAAGLALRPAAHQHPLAAGSRHQPVPSGRIDRATLQAAILTALRSSGSDILYVRRQATFRGRSVPAIQHWFWPVQPRPGRRAHALTLQQDGAGAPMFSSEYSCVAGRLSSAPVPCINTGIDYRARTWMRARLRTTLPVQARTSMAELRELVAGSDWRIAGTVSFGGQSAIDLRTTAAAPFAGRLLINARTHLPIQMTQLGPGSQTWRVSYELLAPTAARLAALPTKIPVGFRQVPFPHSWR